MMTDERSSINQDLSIISTENIDRAVLHSDLTGEEIKILSRELFCENTVMLLPGEKNYAVLAT
jgi:hypothetical protein